MRRRVLASLAKSGGWAPVPNARIDVNGGAQIDFGFKIGSNDEIVIDANPIHNNDIWGYFFKAGTEWTLGAYYQNYYFGTQLLKYLWGTFNKHKRCVFKQVANKWYETDVTTGVEGLIKTWSAFAEEKVTSTSLKTAEGSNAYGFKGYIYHVSQKRNGVLEHDLYPREIDGVAGMFDMVTGDFKTNIQNHGTITYGEG